ncbi:MAG: hypothetical protein ACRD4D_10215, partial [Candidatus Acidiferrales bacterium]
TYRRVAVFLPGFLGVLLTWAAPLAAPQSRAPQQPLEEIVQRFAEKENAYAGAHGLYRYRLTVRVAELGEGNRVLGEFEQVGEVDFDPSGRRRMRLLENPRTDLIHLSIPRVELTDLEFVPLFIARPENVPKYDITYLTRERVDEVETYLFRLQPKEVVRLPDELFEGIVYVDADQLDVVRAHGKLLPVRGGGVFGDYFKTVELYREPVDGNLFTTFVRADDVLSARGETVRIRLTLRFSNHERVR